MTERELMLAVVEAARDITQQWLPGEMTEHERENADYEGAYVAMIEMMRPLIHALDAHTPEPEGEMVTMGLIRSPKSGRFAGTMEPDQEDPRDWEHVGNIVFRAPARVVLPTVAATIAPLEGKPHD